MKEDFTTIMHSEFLEKEETVSDIVIMGVFGSMKRNMSLKKALDEYKGITYDFFISNVVRVIGFNSYEEFYEKYGNLLNS